MKPVGNFLIKCPPLDRAKRGRGPRTSCTEGTFSFSSESFEHRGHPETPTRPVLRAPLHFAYTYKDDSVPNPRAISTTYIVCVAAVSGEPAPRTVRQGIAVRTLSATNSICAQHLHLRRPSEVRTPNQTESLNSLFYPCICPQFLCGGEARGTVPVFLPANSSKVEARRCALCDHSVAGEELALKDRARIYLTVTASSLEGVSTGSA